MIIIAVALMEALEGFQLLFLIQIPQKVAAISSISLRLSSHAQSIVVMKIAFQLFNLEPKIMINFWQDFQFHEQISTLSKQLIHFKEDPKLEGY